MCGRHRSWDFLPKGGGELRFQDFALGELDLLRRAVTAGETVKVEYLEAGPLGQDTGWFSYDCEQEDGYGPWRLRGVSTCVP